MRSRVYDLVGQSDLMTTACRRGCPLLWDTLSSLLGVLGLMAFEVIRSLHGRVMEEAAFRELSNEFSK